MELEVTWGRVVSVWWAYFWRSFIAVVVCVPVSYFSGYALAALFSAIGIPSVITILVALSAGFTFGCVITLVPLKMILGKDFGEFRLVLIQKS